MRAWASFLWFWCISTPRRWARWWRGHDTSKEFDAVFHVFWDSEGSGDPEQYLFTVAIFALRPVWGQGVWFVERDREIWRYRRVHGFTEAQLVVFEAHDNLSRAAGERVRIHVTYEQMPDEAVVPSLLPEAP